MKPMKLNQNEDGIIAIVVTVIVLVVISITTLGFAQLSRREVRQTLDRQLSSEANYAAESGINEAIYAINGDTTTTPKRPPLKTAKTDCTPDTGLGIAPVHWSPTGQTMTLPAIYASPAVLGGISSSSQYTCLLVDPSPPNLEYSAVTEDKSVRADFKLTDSAGAATAANKIVIGWSGSKNFVPAGTITFPSKSNWTPGGVAGIYAPILRVDLTNLKNGASDNYSRDYMINNTYTGFFYPTGSPTNTPGNTPFGNGSGVNRGEIVSGSCKDRTGLSLPPGTVLELPQNCNVVINVSGLSSDHFLLRLKSIYDTSRVTVKAEDSASKLLKINGGQILIDATGRATDVLRRQQVRISAQPPVFSDYAVLSSDSICKRLFTSTSGTNVDSSVVGQDSNVGLPSGACVP